MPGVDEPRGLPEFAHSPWMTSTQRLLELRSVNEQQGLLLALLRLLLMSASRPFRGQSGPSGFFPLARGARRSPGSPRPGPSDPKPLVVSGRASRLRRGKSPARLPWVVPTAFRYRLDHVLGHNPLPSPRTLTEQALEAGDRADRHAFRPRGNLTALPAAHRMNLPTPCNRR